MPSRRNCGTEFDSKWIENFSFVNKPAVLSYVKDLTNSRSIKKHCQVAWLLRAVTCIDLTTLCGDDSFSNVERLCWKAANPISPNLLKSIGMDDEGIHTGAVCVYPARVADCKKVLASVGPDIPIASVATGFPTGQYHLRTRLLEIEAAIEDEATEIDVVINRDLALCGKWEALYDEVKQMRKWCGEDVHLKTILATGELESLTNVYKASMVCMMAGADFIKTSTGKEAVNATLPVGTTMARAIKDYEHETGFQVGFKPAGGIRTAKDAVLWQMLMKDQLGDPWLFPDLFRIGASGLLCDIEKQLYNVITGIPASPCLFPYV